MPRTVRDVSSCGNDEACLGMFGNVEECLVTCWTV